MTDVIIIGAGFGLALPLKKSRRYWLVILERAGQIGGTRRENLYPGCACDGFTFAFRKLTSRFDPSRYIIR